MWSRSKPVSTHRTAHDATVGKCSRKQKKSPYATPKITMKLHRGLYHRSLPTPECSGRRWVGVDHTWSPLNIVVLGVPHSSMTIPWTIPRTKTESTTSLLDSQAFTLHDPAALCHPELIANREASRETYAPGSTFIIFTKTLDYLAAF